MANDGVNEGTDGLKATVANELVPVVFKFCKLLTLLGGLSCLKINIYLKIKKWNNFN